MTIRRCGKMKVVRKRPGEEPEICEIENTQEALQAVLGGEPEYIRFSTDASGVVRKNSKRLRPNTTFCGYQVHGTLLVVGYDGKTLSDLPKKFHQRALSWLGRRSLWRS